MNITYCLFLMHALFVFMYLYMYGLFTVFVSLFLGRRNVVERLVGNLIRHESCISGSVLATVYIRGVAHISIGLHLSLLFKGSLKSV